jgi:hypothetical protein
LEAIFLEHARCLNIAVKRPLIHPFHQLEYEVLVIRFAFDDKVFSQGLLPTMRESLRWFFKVRADKFLGRLGRLVWLIFLALASKWLIEKVLPVARAQTGRSPFWKLALGITRSIERKSIHPPNIRL